MRRCLHQTLKKRVHQTTGSTVIPPIQLSQAAGFALPLEEGEGITLLDGALDVTDNGTVGGIIHELDADLGHVTGVAGAAQDLDDLCELDGLFLQGKTK